MTHSDNTATDVVLRLLGGVSRVNEMLNTQGIAGLSVDRNTADLITDYFDSQAMRKRLAAGENVQQAWQHTLEDPSDSEQWAQILERRQNDSAYLDAFRTDPRDKGCARAMTDLLAAIASGGVLSERSAKLLFGIMERCVTGDQRIRAGVPASATVANKTGSLYPAGGAINDAGMVTLPDGKGRVVLTIFTDIIGDDFSPQEQTIAELAALVYQYLIEE